MDALWNLASFIVALGILVTIHEYGHFWVARKLGVKVLTFSVGFGKPLLQKVGKDGVRYVIAAIPLGGYVKMLDEREADQEISEEDRPFAFNQKSVWVRIAIVLAGPIANFLLAIFLYWCMFMIGTDGLKPVVGDPPQSSIAFNAGLLKNDHIVAVDGEAIITTQDLVEGLAKRLGDKGKLILTVKRKGNSQGKNIFLDLQTWQVDDERPQILHSLGIYHLREDATTEIAVVTEGNAAAKAGIQVGDIITMIDGQPVSKWRDMVVMIRAIPNKPTSMQVNRNGELIPISVVIGTQEYNGETIGLLGVEPLRFDFSAYIVTQESDIFLLFCVGL